MNSQKLRFLFAAVLSCLLLHASTSHALEAELTVSAGELLVVTSSGTLELREGHLRLLPPSELEQARAELEALNDDILDGHIEAFTVGDPRLNARASLPALPGNAKNCYCDDSCCSGGACCASGWWIFCWKLGSC